MHISEGVLSAPVLLTGAALAATGTVIGLKKIDYDRVAHVGILSSAFFVSSLIHVNIGPSSAHLVLNGLVGLLLGWAAFPAILVALILQAVFFQYGGITVLGINTLNMALPAVICYYLFHKLLWKKSMVGNAAAFACGFLSVFLSGIMLAASLIFTEESFWEVAWIIVGANFPVMIIEGIVTAFAVGFLKKVQPTMLVGFTQQTVHNLRPGSDSEFTARQSQFAADTSESRSCDLKKTAVGAIVFILTYIAVYATPALAHRVTIFAWVQDNRVHTESKFSGGKLVNHGTVEVYDMDGKKLLQGKTDENGEFSFVPPIKAALKIVLIAGTGHRAQWMMREEDMASITMAKSATPEQTLAEPDGLKSDIPESSKFGKNELNPPPTVSGIDLDTLKSVVADVMDKKLAPVTEKINRLQKADQEPDVTDIIGGIGYIFGITGVAMYFHSRRRKE